MSIDELHPHRPAAASSAQPAELLRRTHVLGTFLAGLVGAFGVIVVVGWLTNVHDLGALGLPGVGPVRPSVGVALTALAGALVLGHRRRWSRVVVALALAVCVYAIVSMVDRALGLDLGIDQALAPHGLDVPDGAPVAVAAALLLTASAVVVVARAGLGWASQWLSLASFMVAATLTLDAVEVGAAGAAAPPFSQIVGVALTLLAWSAAVLRPESTPLATFFGPLPSARLLRIAAMIAFIVPLLATVVINVVGEWGAWSSEDADALITSSAILTMLLTLLYIGRRLIGAEALGLETLDRLLAAAERVQELYDDAPTGYLSAKADGEITELNATLCDWLARPRASVLGRRFVDLATEATRPDVQRAFDDLLLGRVIEDLEFDLERAAGAPLAVGMRAEPRRDTDGAPVLVRVTLFDATQQRAAERARRKADARYREIVETANEGIWMLDAQGRTTFVNPRAAQIVACEPEEMIGRPVTDFLDEQGLRLWRQRGGESGVAAELSLQAADGGTVWVLLSTTALKGEDGRATGSLGMLTDVTARREAELRVQDDQRRFQQLVDENPAGLAIKDLDLRYQLVNRAFAEAVGVSPSALVGERAAAVVPPDQAAETEALQRRAIAERRVIHEERRMVFRTGAQTRLNTYFPLLDADGEPYAVCVTTTDVSELKEMEHRLADLNRDLEARVVSRTRELEMANQDLASFASTVAHDLRAPLRTISGFSGIVLEQYRDQVPEEAQHYLDIVARGATDMSQLIDDLLTFARTGRQDLERHEVELAPLVSEALADLSGAESTDRVELVIAPDLPACLADPRLLRIVLQNLLANALKFTRGREDRRVELGWTPGDGGEVTYWVRDNGVGFDPAQADRLFTMFQRLHASDEFEGTGLGLAIVARIVHRHGGSVSASGSAGEGATISFALGAEDARWRLRRGD